MKRDAVAMTLLFDSYGALLTQKQQELFDQYYNQDLSLAEIAENEGISRQGVHDAIARAEALLLEFEQKTGCMARGRRVAQALQTIESAAAAIVAGVENPAQKAETILAAVRAAKECSDGLRGLDGETLRRI